MNLTIAKVRAFTKRALRDNALDAEIESIEWIGKRCKYRYALSSSANYGIEFRTARVILKASDGRRVYKTATLETNNAFEIK
jgi:hypothetical protein